jgi:hypothetical protein
MGESRQRRRRRSKLFKDQLVPETKFGICVYVLAGGIKPAQWLAQRVACSERHANRLINGQRKVTARAIVAINTELVG